MSWWMITVVEKRDVVTRVPVKLEAQAKTIHQGLRERKEKEGWLAVTISQVNELPHRTYEEKNRALKLAYTP